MANKAMMDNAVNLDELSQAALNNMASKKLKNDGFEYVVCRPKRPDNILIGEETRAPYIIYRINKSLIGNETLHNKIRYTYYYQCMRDYGLKLDYYYVSAINLSKFLNQEF